jgi:hypothetical protein
MNHHHNHHYLTPPSMNFQQLPHLFQQEINPIKKEDARCAQMTIFYDGKVIVLDDITAEKAKDIMVFSTNNYAAYPSFLAGNSANKTVQVPSTVPSTVPVIYGNFFFWIYNILEDILDLYHMVFMVLFCVFFIHDFCFLYIQIYQ